MRLFALSFQKKSWQTVDTSVYEALKSCVISLLGLFLLLKNIQLLVINSIFYLYKPLLILPFLSSTDTFSLKFNYTVQPLPRLLPGMAKIDLIVDVGGRRHRHKYKLLLLLFLLLLNSCLS